MKWFKMLWLNSKEREAIKRMDENITSIAGNVGLIAAKDLAPDPISDGTLSGKPYRNIIFSNGNITVIFPDGTVLDKMGIDRDFFNKVRDCNTQDAIELMMMDTTTAPPPVEMTSDTIQERELVSDNLDILRKSKDFVVEGNKVIMKGVSLEIPAIIIASFIEVMEKMEQAVLTGSFDNLTSHDYFDQYQALKMFWLKLALNPLPQSREDLLVFCRNNDVRITNNGNLILYRRILSKEGADTEYVKFVSQTYYSLKRKGEDVRMYAVGQKLGGAYYFRDLREDNVDVDNLIGNLYHLYLELPKVDNNNYTAYHDQKVVIKIGGIYKIADDKINLDNGLCAAGGLHAAAVDYNYSSFGNVPVVVLVNPSKAITVPRGETGKLRTTEMFVACINSEPHGKHFDESALSAFDEEYHDFTLEELEEAAANKSFDLLSVKDNTPDITLVDLDVIKDLLKNRIKEIL